MTVSTFGALSRAQLATLVPELLLGGHLIDRAALAHVLVVIGPDGMRDVAIDEWIGASPVYTKRMQRALRFEGDDVVTIFKGLQLDIGAPPQFMDFRYTVHDRWHGEFALAHCGALMDVAPMGESYVRRMCHDIEDPTFDATAVATNAHAVMRPIHRPPEVPERPPHCAWTVTIDESNDAPPYPEPALAIGRTRAATFAGVSEIDPSDDGLADYSGPLWQDVPFSEFSASALVRMAEEVCLQGHLLALSFRRAVAARLGDDTARDMMRKGLTGIAGVVAGRLHDALAPGSAGLAAAAAVLRVHPAFNPVGYTGVSIDDDGSQLTLTIAADSPAAEDGAWPCLIDGANLLPVQAMLRAIDPHLQVAVESSSPAGVELRITVDPWAPLEPEAGEVLITRVSTGAAFVLADRRNLLPVLNS